MRERHVLIRDRVNGQLLSVPCRVYKIKMKPGTTGTMDDPHRPMAMDLLDGLNHKWEMDMAKGIIEVSAGTEEHALLERAGHERVNG